MLYNTADPAMPPNTCATTYAGSSATGNRLLTTNPTDTAGFKWHPEMWPMAKAMVSTVRPNARATPANPMPSVGKPAARTAEPQPPKTSQKVPKNSAMARLVRVMRPPSSRIAMYFDLPAWVYLDAEG